MSTGKYFNAGFCWDNKNIPKVLQGHNVEKGCHGDYSKAKPVTGSTNKDVGQDLSYIWFANP